ncbi:hypothetical protein C4K38_3020 [Pseudomonas chlororaphis subsp. piscium]|nr:hypothetical protein C4K38_3020 [Pseudomonas chlororaphis subsp. piscium]
MHHLPYLMKTPIHCFAGQGFAGLIPEVIGAGSNQRMTH